MKKARTKVDAELTIADLGPAEIERIRRKLSFPNPEYVRAFRLGKKPSISIPASEDCIRELVNGNIVVPRGAVLEVRRELAQRGIKLEVIRDERTKNEKVSWPKPLMLELRDYQAEAANRLIHHTQGLVIFPCGGGKTSAGIGCIHAAQQRSIVLVHTDDLLAQWVDAVRERMGVEPGVVRGGQEPDWKPITIASVFKLVRMLDDEATLGELAKFGFVIVDEAHHQPAATFKKVLGCIPAYYRLGLTATPEREDGRTKLIDWSFGDVICQRTVPELVRAGWLILPQGYAVHTGWKYEYKGGRPDVKSEATARALVASKSRNALIAKCAHREYNNGCVVLVMTSRLAHVPKLRAALEDRGVDSIGLNGKSTRKKRTDTIKAMRKGEPMVVVSLPIFDEGVDVPSLGAIMLAFPEKAKGKLIQRSGRLMRPFRGRTPTLYDFLDDDVELCANRWEARKRVLTRYLGIELTELSHDEI